MLIVPQDFGFFLSLSLSDVLENAFTSLSDEDYEVAMKHVRELLDLDPDQETSKYDAKMDIMWAVVSAFNK